MVVAGRPNVGKSSLVNRSSDDRAAVVEESPGVTRDRKVLDAEWNGVPFRLVDTGGWLAGGRRPGRQGEPAVRAGGGRGHLVLLVVDVTVGVTDEDLAAAKVIRRAGVPVRLVANKVDDAGREAAAWEFVSLGVGDPWTVSAIHGRGTGDLLDEVVRLLPGATDLPATRGGDAHGTGTGRSRRRDRRWCPPRWPWSVGPTWASRPCSTG